MVVEDEQTIRELLVEVLRDEGYATVAAADGPSALDLMAARVPDLVLMDVMLPGPDRREVVRRMRERPFAWGRSTPTG